MGFVRFVSALFTNPSLISNINNHIHNLMFDQIFSSPIIIYANIGY